MSVRSLDVDVDNQDDHLHSPVSPSSVLPAPDPTPAPTLPPAALPLPPSDVAALGATATLPPMVRPLSTTPAATDVHTHHHHHHHHHHGVPPPYHPSPPSSHTQPQPSQTLTSPSSHAPFHTHSSSSVATSQPHFVPPPPASSLSSSSSSSSSFATTSVQHSSQLSSTTTPTVTNINNSPFSSHLPSNATVPTVRKHAAKKFPTRRHNHNHNHASSDYTKFTPSSTTVTATHSPVCRSSAHSNSKNLKAANMSTALSPAMKTSKTPLLHPRTLAALVVFGLFFRGQFFIASTFAGTRPYRGGRAGAAPAVFADAHTAWKDCAQIIAMNLQDIGDAGRLWLRHAYVGSNRMSTSLPTSSSESMATTTLSSASSERQGDDAHKNNNDNGRGNDRNRNGMAGKSSLFADDDQYRCRCLKPELHVVEQPRVTAIVQSFNHHHNIANISESLKAARAVDEVIVCEDGSTDGSLHDWAAVLPGPNHFIIRSNNLHELRSYNRALRISSGDVVVLLQDDDELPLSDAWVANALRLFAALPDLGVLGGYIGQTWDYDSGVGREFGDQVSSHGGVRDGATQALPFIEPSTNIPFMYSECTWIAPLFVRRAVLDRVGGLDLSIAKRGEPGVWQDCVFSYDAWIHGFTVGTFHVPFRRGIGGHGSAKSALKRKLRDRVYGRALRHANRKFPRRRIHEAVVSLNLQTLTPRPQRHEQQQEQGKK